MTNERENSDLETINFSLFKDSLAAQILYMLSSSEDADGRSNDMVADLDEFATYLASEVWPALPNFIREIRPRDIPSANASLTSEKTLNSKKKKSKRAAELDSNDFVDTDTLGHSVDPEDIEFHSLPPEFVDSLLSYNILATPSREIDDLSRVYEFLRDVLSSYIPLASSTRAGETEEDPPGRQKDECEICERVVPLTRHHLVPRASAAKAIKRSWQEEKDLTRYAWICR